MSSTNFSTGKSTAIWKVPAAAAAIVGASALHSSAPVERRAFAMTPWSYVENRIRQTISARYTAKHHAGASDLKVVFLF